MKIPLANFSFFSNQRIEAKKRKKRKKKRKKRKKEKKEKKRKKIALPENPPKKSRAQKKCGNSGVPPVDRIESERRGEERRKRKRMKKKREEGNENRQWPETRLNSIDGLVNERKRKKKRKFEREDIFLSLLSKKKQEIK